MSEIEYLTIQEVATKLKQSPRTIKRWDKQHKFPNAIGAGRTRRIPPTDVENVDKEPVVENKAEPESPEVKKTGEDATIAENKNKQSEQEIEKKLREKGFANLEMGAVEIKKMHEEAKTNLAETEKGKAELAEARQELEIEKEKVATLYTAIKLREEKVDERLEQAIVLEQGQTGIESRCKALIEELRTVATYHNEHIQPCVRALRVIRKSIYSWIEPLNATKYDFSKLYNYIGGTMNSIEKYLDSVPKTIEPDVIDELLEEKVEPVSDAETKQKSEVAKE